MGAGMVLGLVLVVGFGCIVGVAYVLSAAVRWSTWLAREAGRRSHLRPPTA